MARDDRVTRAMTSDGAFRVIAAITTDTARQAAEAQGLSGEDALSLAELITGAVLLRETTQPGRRVQVQLRDRRGATLVADALPDGTNRGILNPGSGENETPDGDVILQVNYTLPNGALHQGLIDVPDGSPLSTALMRYMQQSEQTVSVIAVAATNSDGSSVSMAGGYVVQLLPEADRLALEAMTEHLDGLDTLAEILGGPAPTSRQLIEHLLAGFEHAELADSPLTFGCTCSEARILNGLASLAAEEVATLIAAEETLDIRCDACGQHYTIDPDLLRAVVTPRERN